jgi:hypothetical protein
MVGLPQILELPAKPAYHRHAGLAGCKLAVKSDFDRDKTDEITDLDQTRHMAGGEDAAA